MVTSTTGVIMSMIYNQYSFITFSSQDGDTISLGDIVSYYVGQATKECFSAVGRNVSKVLKENDESLRSPGGGTGTWRRGARRRCPSQAGGTARPRRTATRRATRSSPRASWTGWRRTSPASLRRRTHAPRRLTCW